MSGLGAYLHPAFQTGVLIFGLYVLGLGLKVRNRHRSGTGPHIARLAGRHIRLARWFTGLYTLGYGLGLGGMHFALDKPLYQTAHSYFATVALALFLASAYLGRRLRLRPGNDDARQLHSYCAFLAMFLALLVAFLGMNLLP